MDQQLQVQMCPGNPSPSDLCEFNFLRLALYYKPHIVTSIFTCSGPVCLLLVVSSCDYQIIFDAASVYFIFIRNICFKR